jgi:HD-GYP domain-containing protein (c-di-GMP phosphodiesterase class II)
VSATTLALNGARNSLERNQPLSGEALESLRTAAIAIAQALAECPEAALALNDLAVADAYTHSHSLRVTTIGLLVAQRIIREEGWIDYRGDRRYDRVEERLTKLGMGLLVHDIGKLAVPMEILNKPGALTGEEYDLVKTHTVAGASLLPPSRVSPLVRAVVRSHHERWDGGGYPDGKAGATVHQFARLAAVCDVYDAVTSDRPYHEAEAAHVGVRVIERGAGTQFDADVAAHFLRLVMPYPVGTEVKLPDGRTAVVASVNREDRYRPQLRVQREDGSIEQFFCDLSTQPSQVVAA